MLLMGGGFISGNKLNLLTEVIEVEWVLSGQRAVEPGLEVRGPAALVLVGAAAVRLADARHARVHGLQRRGRGENGE